MSKIPRLRANIRVHVSGCYSLWRRWRVHIKWQLGTKLGLIVAMTMLAEAPEEPGSPSKARQLLQKAYSLVDYHSLPEYLRDNEFILRHYRADWPLKQILLSMFSLHNETLNIWTHGVGFLLFLALTITTVRSTEIPTIVTGLIHEAPAALARWPFYTFLGGAMFCLLCSSLCHLLNCHSKGLSAFLLRLDYSGIATLIAASFYPPVYYSFLCNPLMRNTYLISITILGIFAAVVSLLPAFQTPRYRPIRGILFTGMGLSGVAPLLHKVILHGGEPLVVLTTVYEAVMGLLYVSGALVYVTRVPERWKPGLFDIAGHSHQLFHVLIVAAAYVHYRAGLVYIRWRIESGCSA